MSIMLVNFPEEATIIGNILTSYVDIEYRLVSCVAAALNNDISIAIKCLYRLRGGNVRIQVADAIIRPAYDALGLKDQYETALGALRFSTSIRNQYSYCFFVPLKEDGLFFTDLGKAANRSIGKVSFTMRHIDLSLLNRQHEYLKYTFEWLWYLEHEYKMRAAIPSSRDAKAPTIIARPPLHNPPEEHKVPDSVRAGALPPEGLPSEDH